MSHTDFTDEKGFSFFLLIGAISAIRGAKPLLRIPAPFGHRFRFYPDSVPEFVGQDSGDIRTAIRSDSDSVPD
ncbi:MAG: hypothetical protein ACYC23_17870, partial [Limisphaerales bacterium]